MAFQLAEEKINELIRDYIVVGSWIGNLSYAKATKTVFRVSVITYKVSLEEYLIGCQ